MGEKEDLQPWATATTVSVTVLAFVCVVLRVISRLERKQKLWWDDWMIIFSMLWNFIVVGFIFAMIHEGMGIHADKLPTSQIILIAKYLVVAEILYVFNLVWTKLSILLMYYRIFRFPYFKKWAYAIGTFVILWVICITFLFIFICVPVQKLWYPSLPGHCISQVGTWIANATSTIATDLIILFLPLPQVWKLQLRLSEKIALTVAFGLGFFVIFASAYRFTVLFSYTSADSSYTLAPTVGWTAIEMSAGIVSACLPTLRPALQLAARKLGLRSALVPALFRSRTSPLSKSDDSQMPADSTASTAGMAARANRHSFYHLPDEEGGVGVTQKQIKLDAVLRPKHDRGLTVTNIRGSRGASGLVGGGTGLGNGEEGDEVPLHGIMVSKDFRQDG
ncbi:Rhodanese-like domain family protein [Aspergillus niger]|uniref:Rhodanese-like domain family protein n=1 Tax=Aspergillus niger TaxID=5061 RepID=A0A3F3RMF9_ASPNG|nr:hypothetical protein CBS12448_1436 [Aspergillus niger]KAI3008427.1 hypothetical protein CBS147345_6984 [Aspergillus niger]KAI3053154.1 hypothetical protein CBS147352_4442 [Aspergillus niger]KAI3061645.1 hypothetical protein CBS147353_9818 [Aspergillus niger]TPR09838.1 Rhodanese-like domain family protein [Aspergillus niger]